MKCGARAYGLHTLIQVKTSLCRNTAALKSTERPVAWNLIPIVQTDRSL